MRQTLIAVVALAAFSIPAMAQQSAAPGNSPQDQPRSGGAPTTPNLSPRPNKDRMGISQPQPGTGSMRMGASQIKTMQRDLNRQGFNVGRVDGVMGPKTEAALRSFQQKNGMNATGRPTRESMTALEGKGGQTQQRGRRSASNKRTPRTSASH